MFWDKSPRLYLRSKAIDGDDRVPLLMPFIHLSTDFVGTRVKMTGPKPDNPSL